MGLALPIYGAFLGLICAFTSLLMGHVGILGALALYSGTGILAVLLAGTMIAVRDNDNDTKGPNNRPLAWAIDR